jgi:hypothetical protein
MLVSALARHVDESWFDVWDTRLQSEILKFAVIDGKEQAGTGGHDDMLFALALALVAVDQRLSPDEMLTTRRPQTMQEKIAFFQQTGRFAGADDYFDDDEPEVMDDSLAGVGTLPQVQYR